LIPQVQHYILVVQAQDAGHPALSSTLTVYCNVLDLNDNTPLFDPMSYTNEIFENISVATPVVTVSATDLDSGENFSFRNDNVTKLVSCGRRADYRALSAA
jgi:protocadherin Fat 4